MLLQININLNYLWRWRTDKLYGGKVTFLV